MARSLDLGLVAATTPAVPLECGHDECTKGRECQRPNVGDNKCDDVKCHDLKRDICPSSTGTDDGDDIECDISEEDLKTLPHVPGKISWQAYTIAFVEFCERFSFVGTASVFVNFIQRALPPGSKTGAPLHGIGQAGALNMGQRASTGILTFFYVFMGILPIFGAFVADQYWGRFQTIIISIAVAVVGHIILIVSVLPPILVHGKKYSLGVFLVGLIVLSVGTAGFKSCIAPLIGDQSRDKHMKIVYVKGRKSILDPACTVSRIFMHFYFVIVLGAFLGHLTMVFAEKYVGFWLSFTMPTIMFCVCPMVLFACRSKYYLVPPTGSMIYKCFLLVKTSMRGHWSFNLRRVIRHMKSEYFWDLVTPSKVEHKPVWMNFDDAWVDQVRRGFKSCTVFIFYPFYDIALSQMYHNLTSQAATMRLNNLPNDIMISVHSIAVVLLIALMDGLVYPYLTRKQIRFTPVRRIATGFFLGSISMVSSCVLQWAIYHYGECGKYMNQCVPDRPAPISVWFQTIPICLAAISEVFVVISGIEYAYTKAPHNMRSVVYSIFLVKYALTSLLVQPFLVLSEDPLLVWNYGTISVICFVGGILFYWTNRDLDRNEEKLNALPDGKVADCSAYALKNADKEGQSLFVKGNVRTMEDSKE